MKNALKILILILFCSFISPITEPITEPKTNTNTNNIQINQQSIYKVYVVNNYFYLETNNFIRTSHKKDVKIEKYSPTSNLYRFIFQVDQNYTTELIDFNNLRDKDNNVFESQTFFENWYTLNTGFNISQAREQIFVTQDNFKSVLLNIDSSKEYFIDGVVDLGTFEIIIPQNGASFRGHSFDISGFISNENNYTLFKSENQTICSGNLLATDLFLSVTGLNSKIHNLCDYNNFNAIEYNRVNFINCTSLGDLTNYRQYLEDGTGRFNGAPELTFNGSLNGARITTSIARNMQNFTSLFKAGTNLSFNGRFITDINCDLPNTGALINFSDSNIINDESLILKGAFITRSGIIDASDTSIYPNINHTSIKSLWSDNTGLPNTNKYIKSVITTQAPTIVNNINTYYVLNGSFTVETNSHFDMPLNGEFRLLSGNGSYQVTGDFVLESNQNNEIHIRVTKSVDGGITFPIEVNHIKRIINSLSGGRDVGFFPINFIVDLKKNDRLRIEVENNSSTQDITAEIDSFLIISQI